MNLIGANEAARELSALGIYPGQDAATLSARFSEQIALGGTNVLSRPGTYTLSSQQSIPSNCTIELGAGVTLDASAMTVPCFTATSKSNIRLCGDGKIVCAAASVPTFTACINTNVSVRIEDSSGSGLAAIGGGAEITVNPSGSTIGTIDAASINQVIANLSASGGGTVYLGPGIFYVNTAILLKTGVSVVGCGPGITTVKLTNSVAYSNNANVFLAIASQADVTDWSVQNLTIDGNRTNQTEAGSQDNAYNGIRAVGSSSYMCKRFRIFNVEPKNCVYHGIFATDYCSDFDIVHNNCHDNGYRGIHCHGTTSAGTVVRFNVSFNQCHENGLSASAGINTGLFAFLENAFDCRVIGNSIWSEPGCGMEITGRSGAANPASHGLFASNTIYDCGDGIVIQSVPSNVIVTGNTIRSCVKTGNASSAQGYGISLASSGTLGGTDITISNNTVTGCEFWGIASSTASGLWTGLVVSGNTVRGNGTSGSSNSGGMVFNSMTLSTIIGNVIAENNGGAGAQRNLYLNGSDLNVIVGNVVSSASSSYRALELNASDNNVIEGNVLKRNGGNAIVIADAGSANNLIWNNSGDAISDTGTGTASAKFHKADSGGANTGTLTNSPTSGNPAEWLMVYNASGTLRRIPAW